MTDQATRVVPAGWYQDPAIAEQVRWWNGLAWTEHVREKPSAVPAPVTTATSPSTQLAGETATETTAERIAAARELERQFGIGTSENEVITGATALGFGLSTSETSTALERRTSVPATASTGAISGGRTGALNPANPAVQQAAAQRGSQRTATGSAWLIALTPVLTIAAAAGASYLYFYVASTPLVLIAFVLPYLLGFLWAIGDSRALSSRGFAAPRPLWALLGGLVYLVVRRIRIAGSGPLILFLALGAIAVALPMVAYGSGMTRPLDNALTIQNTISTDYLRSGRAVSVACPPLVDAATAGTLYACSATLPGGTTAPVWVSIDGPEGQFSYAMVA